MLNVTTVYSLVSDTCVCSGGRGGGGGGGFGAGGDRVGWFVMYLLVELIDSCIINYS